MGGGASNAVNMQLSARTLALRAAQVRRRGGRQARHAWCMAVTALLGRVAVELLNPGGAIGESCATRLPCLAPQDKLAMTRKRLWWMLSPLALWFGAVIILWLLQFYWLNSAEERVMGGLYFFAMNDLVVGWCRCAPVLGGRGAGGLGSRRQRGPCCWTARMLHSNLRTALH